MYYLCVKHLRFRFDLNTRRNPGDKDIADKEGKFMAFLEPFALGTMVSDDTNILQKQNWKLKI